MAKAERSLRLDRELALVLQECCLEFSEELTLNTKQDFLYLSDPDTYEMLYLSINDPGERNLRWINYEGRMCYEVLQARDAPCSFCTNHLLRKDAYYIWAHENDVEKRQYFLKDKLINWRGRFARMEVVFDVTDRDRLGRLTLESMRSQNMMTSCMEALAADRGRGEAFLPILGIIGRFYEADRVALFYFATDPSEDRVITYLAPNSPPIGAHDWADRAGKEKWGGILREDVQLVLKDMQAIKDRYPLVSKLLMRRGIQSFGITPLFVGERLVGMLCLDNVKGSWGHIYLLKTLAKYTAGHLHAAELEKENYRILNLDNVTGYTNMEHFKRQVAKNLQERRNRRYALLYTDIKNFKYVNDVLGYDVGNRVLKYWTELFVQNRREGEEFARISADKFVFIVWYDHKEELDERFAWMRDMLNRFEQTARRNFPLELAGGIFLIQEQALSLEEMINRANIAQRSVKELPGSRFAIYSDEMRQKTLNDIRLEGEMREGLKNGEFLLYIQPLVAADPVKTGGYIRGEALVRWRKKSGELVPPGMFIPLLEHNGMIVELDQAMFEMACRYIRDNRALFKRPLCLAVNVSRISMFQPGFVENYCRIREEYGILPREIELEFTESIAVERYDRFRDIILRLKAAGFSCALDDFGTGQSSLNVLKNLPLDVLKLDRLFFNPDGESERAKAIFSCVLRMAKELGLETIAEGIELKSQVDLLRELECDYIQGFYFARPVPAGEFQALVQRLIG